MPSDNGKKEKGFPKVKKEKRRGKRAEKEKLKNPENAALEKAALEAFGAEVTSRAMHSFGSIKMRVITDCAVDTM